MVCDRNVNCRLHTVSAIFTQLQGMVHKKSSGEEDQNCMSYVLGVYLHGQFSRAKIADVSHPWRYRLKVRTEPSQGSNPGSSPGIATNPTSMLKLIVYTKNGRSSAGGNPIE